MVARRVGIRFLYVDFIVPSSVTLRVTNGQRQRTRHLYASVNPVRIASVVLARH